MGILVAACAPSIVSAADASGVPDALKSATGDQLRARKVALDKDRVAYKQAEKEFNTQYGSVDPDDSARIAEAQAAQAKLVAWSKRYTADVAAYKKDLAAAVDSELKILDERIQKTHDEIKIFTAQLEGYQAAFDEWTKLGDDARDQAQARIKNMLATVLLSKMTEAKQAENALLEGDARRIKAIFGKAYMNEYLKDLLERVQEAKTDKDVLRLLEVIKTGLSAVPDEKMKDHEPAATDVLRIIELLNKDPKIALLIADGEIWLDTAYGWFAKVEARQRVNQLLDLRDNQLKALQSLSTLYKKDVDSRKALRQAQAGLAQ